MDKEEKEGYQNCFIGGCRFDTFRNEHCTEDKAKICPYNKNNKKEKQ